MNADTLIRPALPATLPNGLPWKPYVYQGLGYDALTPELDDLEETEPVDLPDEPVWPCGTITGTSRHRRAGEPPCNPCREAENEYKRQRKAARKAAS